MLDRMPIIVGSHDVGHAHLRGKFFVLPLIIIPCTRPCTKYEVSSSSIVLEISIACQKL